MQVETLKKHVGKVVVLDLVQGREITTRIQSVSDAGCVLCSKPRVFVPMQNPQNPNDVQVVCVKYGQPLYEADENLEIDAGHIFTVFIPSEPQIAEYARKTGSIVPVGAGAMDQLQGLDLSGISR